MDVISHVLYATFLLETIEVDYINGFCENHELCFGVRTNA